MADNKQQAPQDRRDTFKGNPVKVRKAAKAFGQRGTPDPNGSGERPKGQA